MVAVNLFRGQAAVKVRARFGAVPKSDAVFLLPASATGAQWREARRLRVGASELPTILGTEGAYGSPFHLWWQKTSGWESPEDEAMEMGRRLEPLIAEVWSERHPDAMVLRPGAALYGHPLYPWLCATPDYLAVRSVVTGVTAEPVGEDGGDEPVHHFGVVVEPVECKAYDGGSGWGKPGTDEVPPHIAVQVQVQCSVLGAARGHVVRMRGKRITAYTLEFGGADRWALPAHWVAAGATFAESLGKGIAPPLDGSSATEKTLARLYDDFDPDAQVNIPLSAVLEYRLAMAGVREAEQRKQAAVNLIRGMLGDAGKGVDEDGRVFVERRRYKRAGYEVAPGEVDALFPANKPSKGDV